VSSAILYVAIVAIWACVLIPRWLRRDSARNAGNAANAADAEAVPGGVVRGDVVPVAGEDEVSAADPPAAAVLAGYTETAVYTETATYTEKAYAETVYAETQAGTHAEAPDAGPAREAPPLPPGESRRRMLAARRRLLGMLILLEAAAIALAVFGLAALWVMIPPSVMLVGYLLLLREAAHADGERAQREQEAARARVRAQARASERAARSTPAAATAPAAKTTPAASAAPAAGYEDWSLGRDFAPGLAGKYTASNAEVIDIYEQADEDYRDEYPVKKLRAVGD